MKNFEDIVQVISHILGRDLSLYDESFLVKSLRKRLQKISIISSEAYLAYLTANMTEAAAFFQSLSITYSEFFRGRIAFAILEEIILPRLIGKCEKSRRTETRIWSAGCATGQEAYSVAILLDEIATIREAKIPYRIFASDTSEDALALARAGAYGSESVQNVTMKHIHTYFDRRGANYVIRAGLRDRIDFSSHDLLDERCSCPPTSIFGDFDLVLCCNVLIYYRPAIRQSILNRLQSCLSPTGYLVTDEVERATVEQTGKFQSVAAPAAVFEQCSRRR